MIREATVFVVNNCYLLPIQATIEGVDQEKIHSDPIQSGTPVQVVEERSVLISRPFSELDGQTVDAVRLSGRIGWYIRSQFRF